MNYSFLFFSLVILISFIFLPKTVIGYDSLELEIFDNKDIISITVDDFEEQNKIKNLNLLNIPDGSKIELLSMKIITPIKGSCQIFLDDYTLNKMPISNSFICDHSENISLNTIGKHAVEYKLNHDNELKFVIKNNNVPIESSVIITETIYSIPTYYAKIENGIVTNIIVADENFIGEQDGIWIKTKTDSTLRNNFAGIGFKYDQINDVFIPPQPFDSWILNNTTWKWNPPIKYPDDGNFYSWDENKTQWIWVK